MYSRHVGVVDDLEGRAMKKVEHFHLGGDEVVHKFKELGKCHSFRCVQLQEGAKKFVHLTAIRSGKRAELKSL